MYRELNHATMFSSVTSSLFSEMYLSPSLFFRFLSLSRSLPTSSYLLSSLPSSSFPLTPHLHLFFLYPSFSSPTSRHFNHSFLLFFLLYLIRRLLSAIHPLRLLQPSTVRSVSISQHMKPVKRSKRKAIQSGKRGTAAELKKVKN